VDHQLLYPRSRRRTGTLHTILREVRILDHRRLLVARGTLLDMDHISTPPRHFHPVLLIPTCLRRDSPAGSSLLLVSSISFLKMNCGLITLVAGPGEGGFLGGFVKQTYGVVDRIAGENTRIQLEKGVMSVAESECSLSLLHLS
jgi:hypothetical protein